MKSFFHWLYWVWRFSKFSRPWYIIKTFLYLQLNARTIAIHLDDCMKAMGQMDHPNQDHRDHPSKNKGVMVMKTELRQELVYNGYWKCLPKWKWR